MDKIKQYWMPVIAGLCVISGLGDFNLVAIMLGIGFGFVWWKDVRGSSSVDKKFVVFKIVRWLLGGVGCDMLIHGSVAGGIMVLLVVLMWATGKFSKLKLPQIKFRGVGSAKKKAKKSVPEVVEEVSDAWRQKMRNKAVRRECLILLDDAYSNTQKHDKYFSHKLFEMLKYATHDAYEHSVNKIDLFSCKIARAQMTFETREWQKTSCEVSSTQSIGVDHNQLDIWSLPVGGQTSTYAFEECDRCHGHKHITCPKCHGEHAQWECPDCHGKAGIKYECEKCHGKGEETCTKCHGTRAVTCPDCHGTGEERHRCEKCKGEKFVWEKTGEKIDCPECEGSGKEVGVVEDYPGQCPCPRCKGKGWLWVTKKVRCRECDGKGEVVKRCQKCSGKGNVPCDVCNATGIVKCDACNGEGKVSCSKCDSTGTAYCHTCDGTGEVVCPECNGDGGFASLWKVVRNISRHEKIEAWSDDGLPKALLPKIFPAPDAINGCESLYSASSESTTPDDSLVLSETALKYPALKSMFDSIASIVHAGRHVHVTQQSVELVEIHDIARVEVESNYVSQYSDEYAGKTFICWLNLATGELLDIGFKSERPDSWYESHELSESDRSPYQMLAKIKDGDKDYNEVIELAYTLGNPFAMAEYGRILYEGKTADKKADKDFGGLLQTLASYIGVKEVRYASTFNWANMDEDRWRDVAKRFVKLSEKHTIDGQSVFTAFNLSRKLSHDYRLQYLSAESVAQCLSEWFSDLTERNVRLAAFFSADKFTDKQLDKILGRSPRAYQMLTMRSVFTPTEFGVAMSRGNAGEIVEKFGFNERSRGYTIEDWVDYFIGYDSCVGIEKFIEKVDWRKISEVPAAKLAKIFCWDKIHDKIDLSILPIESVIQMAISSDCANKLIKWEPLKDRLNNMDWHQLTDDQRIEFVRKHNDMADVVLKDVDPNKMSPEILDEAFADWPDVCKAFDPTAYDWSKLDKKPDLWARMCFFHPELKKYCDASKVDWKSIDGQNDLNQMVVWCWAISACPDEALAAFTRWDEIQENWWPDMISRNPKLAEYKKRFGEKP